MIGQITENELETMWKAGDLGLL